MISVRCSLVWPHPFPSVDLSLRFAPILRFVSSRVEFYDAAEARLMTTSSEEDGTSFALLQFSMELPLVLAEYKSTK